MGGTSELRVPTVAVAVELARAGRAPESVELFVADAPRRGRSALVSDVAALLESDHAFVPVREAAAGASRIAIVGKRSILWVAVPLRAAGGGPPVDAVPELVDPADEPSEIIQLFDHRHDVRVELDAREGLDGHVLYTSPADRPRLADHLNLPVRFFRLWTRDALYLVNKDHVVRVLELS